MFVTKIRKVANPAGRKKRRVVKQQNRARRKSGAKRRNPAQLLTLGIINPHRNPSKKRSAAKSMAMTKKRTASRRRVVKARRSVKAASNPRRHRKNSTRVIVMAPKRRNGHRRSKNPIALFGHNVSGKDAAIMVGGGLVGVFVTKSVVPMLSTVTGNNPLVAAIAAVAVAIGGGWLIGKGNTALGSGFAFGGLMQAGSLVMNQIGTYVPQANQLAISGYRNGMGQFVPASYPIPQIPVLTGGSTGMGGPAGRAPINRSYPRPY